MSLPLFELPREFVRNAIFSFLSLKDIGKFDSLVLNASQRLQLREICNGIVVPIVTIDHILIPWLKQRGMSAERIKLADSLIDTDLTGIDIVMKKCLSLDIGNSQSVTADGLCALVEQCHNLLAFSSYSNASFSDDVLCTMAACNAELLEIAIEGYEVRDVSLLALHDNCPKLEMFSFHSKLINDAAVVQFVQKCSSLVEIDLGSCTELTDLTVSAIAQHCANLKDLSLDYCQLITDASVTQLRNLLKLCIGDCYGITEAGIIAIAQNSPAIEILEMQNCEVTAAAAAGLAEHGNKDLLTLKITHSYLTDEDILPVIEKFRDLQVLELEEFFNITDSTVLAIAANMTQLQSLSLYHNHNFTDEGIKAVAAACPELDDLCLDLCDGLTDLAVREIAVKLTKLRDLSLVHMNGLTDAAVVYLANHAKTLESVHLSFPGIDCDSVILLIENSPGMVEITLPNDLALTEELNDLITQRGIYLLPEPVAAPMEEQPFAEEPEEPIQWGEPDGEGAGDGADQELWDEGSHSADGDSDGDDSFDDEMAMEEDGEYWGHAGSGSEDDNPYANDIGYR